MASLSSFDPTAEYVEDLKALGALERGVTDTISTAGLHDSVDRDAYEVEEHAPTLRDVIAEHPGDVLHHIEASMVKLGELEVPDSVVFKAFKNDGLLTLGCDQGETAPWRDLWREALGVEAAQEPSASLGAGWTTTMVLEAHFVNLYDAAAIGNRGLLRPLLRRHHAGGCPIAVFVLPAVQAVILFKWRTWAQRFIAMEACVYVLWLVSFCTFSLLLPPAPEPEPAPDAGSVALAGWGAGGNGSSFPTLDLGALAAVAVASASMLPFAYMEICSMYTQRFNWFSLWNTLDGASYILQLAILLLYLQQGLLSSGWFSITVAAQHVLLMTKLHYYVRVLGPSPLFADSIRIVLHDMRWFLSFLALTLIGWGFAFHTLYKEDRDMQMYYQDFNNFWHSMASMFMYLLAMFDLSVFYNSSHPRAAMAMFMFYEFIAGVLLLNLLIAVMTSTFSKVTEDEGVRQLKYKAEVIDEIENTGLPALLARKGWFPHYVHTLRISPRSTYEVSLGSLWSQVSTLESSLMSAQQEQRHRIEQLDHELSALSRKVSAALRLLTAVSKYRGIPMPQSAAPEDMAEEDDLSSSSDGDDQDEGQDNDVNNDAQSQVSTWHQLMRQYRQYRRQYRQRQPCTTPSAAGGASRGHSPFVAASSMERATSGGGEDAHTPLMPQASSRNRASLERESAHTVLNSSQYYGKADRRRRRHHKMQQQPPWRGSHTSSRPQPPWPTGAQLTQQGTYHLKQPPDAPHHVHSTPADLSQGVPTISRFTGQPLGGPFDVGSAAAALQRRTGLLYPRSPFRNWSHADGRSGQQQAAPEPVPEPVHSRMQHPAVQLKRCASA